MRVALSCDLLRHGGSAGDAEVNSAWLWPLVRPLLQELGHEPVMHTRRDPATAEAAQAAVRGLDPGEAWPRLYSDPARADAVQTICGAMLSSGLVIGHELSPNQLRALVKAGVPVLDLRIDPVRFGADLFLRARTTDPALADLLRQHCVTDHELTGAAAALRVRCGEAAGLPGPALLFVGQTDADASLIEGARLRSVAPFVEQIRGMLEPGWRLLLKPHPYARSNADIRMLHEAVPGSLVVNDNIYALLCAPAVRRVVTLSSSVAAEAELFGKPAVALVRPDRDAVPMDEARITAGGLADVVRQHLGGEARRTQIDLRRAVGQDWGYRSELRLGRRAVFAGQPLRFGASGNGADLCTFGWSAPEAGGCWSDGPVALLLLQPHVPGLVLHLDLIPFVPPGHDAVQMSVRSGAGPVQQATFRRWQRAWIAVPLPATPGPVELRFDILGTTSPAAHGLSADRRQLGVKLLQATVRRRADAQVSRTRQLMTRGVQTAANLALLFMGMG